MCSDPTFPQANKVRPAPRPLVLDTNIVLDLLLFNDPGAQPLRLMLAARQIEWLTTPAMRDEFERVLAYPLILKQMARQQLSAVQLLLEFDAQARIVDVAPTSRLRCGDPDDQKFIDLAVAHKAHLMSKDRAVLRMARRLQVFDVRAQDGCQFLLAAAHA